MHTNNTLVVFAEAMAALDIETIESLLHNDGKFAHIINDYDELELTKAQYLDFLKQKFEERKGINQEINYELDSCINCKVGCPVILFENGRFPIATTAIGNRSKIGLAIEIKENKIFEITLCSLFLKTDN